MSFVLLTAFGIALCSAIGAVIGFSFKRIPAGIEDAVNGCAAGIMLCAAVIGLIIPAVNFSGEKAVWLPTLGIFCGAAFLSLISRAGPLITKKMGMTSEDTESNCRAMLFVLAIAIHHFPEGIAAGVSFGTGSIGDTLTVVSGIAFQNIPEGMIIIPPLLKGGTGKRTAVKIAFISGLTEVLGLFAGYLAITLSQAILPFALSFAAGCMLYVIVDDMVPQTHERKEGHLSTYALLVGFCMMLILNSII